MFWICTFMYTLFNTPGAYCKNFTSEKTLVISENAGKHNFPTDFTTGRKKMVKITCFSWVKVLCNRPLVSFKSTKSCILLPFVCVLSNYDFSKHKMCVHTCTCTCFIQCAFILKWIISFSLFLSKHQANYINFEMIYKFAVCVQLIWCVKQQPTKL